MRHIDEHTLELYVLNAKEVRGRRLSIKNHLMRCVGCYEMAEQLKKIYIDVDAELLKGEEIVAGIEKGIVHVPRDLEVWNEPAHAVKEVPPMEVIPLPEARVPTVWKRLGLFGREHPVLSSSFGVALLVSIVLSLLYLSSYGSNPAYYRYNAEAGELDVYSSRNKLLWSAPASNLERIKSLEVSTNVAFTVIVNLSGDAKNEVVTSIPIGDEKLITPLKIFDPDGNLLRKFTFPTMDVNFRGVHYDAPFGAGEILKERMPGGHINLFVSSCVGSPFDGNRSPSILWRLDGNLNVVGKYWHYGVFSSYLIDTPNNGSREIALVGSDDMEDMSANDFQFLAILDPQKLVGDQESSHTPGFGFEASPAELYYIKFPKTDLEYAIGARAASMIPWISQDGIFYVRVWGDWPNPFGFDFVFNSKNMSVREVKFIGPTEQTYARLKKEGKLRGTFDEKYLENLKNGVRYWDGKEWVKEPTMVLHSSARVGQPAAEK